MTKPLSIIAAVASNGAIGKNNNLLWHISDDLKYFKKLTSSHTIIMGRKTFESFPNGPLPNREHIILSRTEEVTHEKCSWVKSVGDAIKKAEANRENFVIGGGKIYELFLPAAQKMYLTHVLKDFDADTFFPVYNPDDWSLEKGELKKDEKSGLTYSFDILTRKA